MTLRHADPCRPHFKPQPKPVSASLPALALSLPLLLAVALQLPSASRACQNAIPVLSASLAAHSLCLPCARRWMKPLAAFGATLPSGLVRLHGPVGIAPDRTTRQQDPGTPGSYALPRAAPPSGSGSAQRPGPPSPGTSDRPLASGNHRRREITVTADRSSSPVAVTGDQ